MFSSKMLTHSLLIIHYTMEQNKTFLLLCLQAFSTAEILKSHVNGYFKINGKQRIKMPKKGKYVKLKN